MFDTIPIRQMLICLVSGAAVSLLPSLRRPAGFLLLSLLGIAVAHRQAAVGYALTNTVVFLFTLGLARLAKQRRAPMAFRWRWSCVALLMLVSAFLAGRWFHLESRGLSVAGIQWLLFNLDMWLLLRLVTFIWEFGSGRIQPKLLPFTVWTCMPFTALGPLLRYSQFEPQLPWAAEPKRLRELYSREWLITLMMAAVQIIAGILLITLHGRMFAEGSQSVPFWAKLIDSFGIAPWSFLLLWGGYYKLMECLSPQWNVSLPPSFNRPYGRPNISEFWANWNMTATSVFRDYLFYTRWGLRKPNVYLNTLMIFLLVGLWHGLNWYWVIFGLLHGLGFSCFIWYRQRRGLKRFEITGIPHRLFGRALTYLFVCSCWILPSRILKLLGYI